jgi:branched-subunit amino acid transport protein
MNAWTVVLAVGLGSYLLRMSMVGAANRIRLPASLEDSASSVAPAAFAALAVTSIGGTVLDGTVPQALAPIAAVTVAALAVTRTGSSYAAVLAGMPTLWVLTLLTSA